MSEGIEPVDPRAPRGLASAEAYPAEADAVSDPLHIQTHLSHVFLTRSRVYKLRKAVRFSFVDFGSRSARDQDCVRELALNRRLAPDVYLGLAPLWLEGDKLRVGSPREELTRRAPGGQDVLEHCVVMRRLPDGTDALQLLERGQLTSAALERLGAEIARFHAAHRLEPVPSADAWRDHVSSPVRGNLEALRDGPLDPSDRARLEQIEERAEAFLREHGRRFEERRRRGLAVDGHGDLHLQHVWLPDPEGPAVVIDCVEFREDFRQLDPASEVAFLAMDLTYRGRPDLAHAFLASYADASDDYGLYDVVDYFVSYRAAVRAKVAALAARDSEVGCTQREAAAGSVSRHLELAARALDPRPGGRVFVVMGRVGTGKSTVARAIAEPSHGVVLASDRVRKRRAGLDVRDRTHDALDEGIYAPARTEATYAALLERAEPVVRSGRTVVLDATFATRERRAALEEWAARLDVPLTRVEVRCAPTQVQARLIERLERDDDASDAGPERAAALAARYDPPEEWPSHWIVHTDQPTWRDTLQAELARLLEESDGIKGD